MIPHVVVQSAHNTVMMLITNDIIVDKRLVAACTVFSLR